MEQSKEALICTLLFPILFLLSTLSTLACHLVWCVTRKSQLPSWNCKEHIRLIEGLTSVALVDELLVYCADLINIPFDIFAATNPNIRRGGQATSNWKIQCGSHP